MNYDCCHFQRVFVLLIHIFHHSHVVMETRHRLEISEHHCVEAVQRAHSNTVFHEAAGEIESHVRTLE